MKVENGKITETTEAELYEYYLTRDWFELYDFQRYVRLCKENGTRITDEGGCAE